MQGISKGQVLKELKNNLSGNGFEVPDLILINCLDWFKNDTNLIETIKNKFKGKKIAIRSSASDEDGKYSSKAGEYESILNINSSKGEEIKSSIEKIISSYKKNKIDINNQEILIQEMIMNVSMSGVVFTHELNSGAPYYVINYDDISGLTNTVTSGEGKYSNRTLYIHRDSSKSIRSERFKVLIYAIRDLEIIVRNKFLDIEFALDQNLKPFLFQVRPITTNSHWDKDITNNLNEELKGIKNLLNEKFKPQDSILGESTVLGQMPDWNPAEMIGRAPRPLSFSLYSHLITKNAWREARKLMGYKYTAGKNLMLSLAGQPYIDTRLSFNSFLPNDLSNDIGNKLVNYWLKLLKENPHYHDKIEFEIAITNFTFDIDEKIEENLGDILDKEEKLFFKNSLYKLTLPLLNDKSDASIPKTLEKIEILSSINLNENNTSLSNLERIIENCITFGTIPFSILARHGFIAKSLMISLVKKGIFTSKEMEDFQSSIRTVASELVSNIAQLQKGEIKRNSFMKRFGHLRPGTYDILSPRYDQINSFAKSKKQSKFINFEKSFQINNSQRESLNELLKKEKMTGITSDKLLNYFAEAIKAREYGKFIFTKSVSAILENIASFADFNKLNREIMSYVPLDNLLKISQESIALTHHDYILEISEKQKRKHKITTAIRLPQVLFDKAGVSIVPFQVSHPNFVTNKKVISNTLYLSARDTNLNLDNKLILIDNADPGYDWIFSQSISGLITKFGGANSHMSIRCAEFGLPAAIGCGEQRFESLKISNRIILDCATGLIQKLD